MSTESVSISTEAWRTSQKHSDIVTETKVSIERHVNANSMEVANKTADEAGDVLCDAGRFAAVIFDLMHPVF